MDGGKETLVSHVSHSGSRKGCVKQTGCVKRGFEGAWIKGLEKPCRPQGAKVLQTSEGSKKRIAVPSYSGKIPAQDAPGEGFPFLDGTGGDMLVDAMGIRGPGLDFG
jgi:hypothetical protein